VYACDENAYAQFRKLFEPIIKELHDFDLKSGALIKHNFDIQNLEWAKLDRTKHCIKYVQVTASRNAEGYSFVPTLDSLSKCEIESKLSKIISEEIDAKLPMNKMSAAEKKKFADEGLLFERHPSVESIIPSSKWSEGCSIYYNGDLSQVVWVNADDHVQFFVTQKAKPDLKQACEKLFTKLKYLESHIPLCHDQNLGYLTCNPAFLGTALRIKVIAQLQKASDSQVKFELLKNFCGQHGIDIRHTAQSTYEFTLSKTFQLGKTEADMVSGLLACLVEILRLEEAAILAEEEAIKKKLKEESEKALKDMPQFDEINTSLIRPFINPDIWLKYGRVATNFGHSLKECVKPGVANHKIGIIAMDSDCYSKFEELFMNVIQIFHEDYRPVNFPLLGGEPVNLADSLKKFDGVKYIVDGYLMWQGNLKDCSFPAGLNKKYRDECSTKLLTLLDPLSKQQNLNLAGIEDVAEIKNSLYYNDLINEKNKIQELSIEWPDQRRALRSPNGKLALLTNVMNHLALIVPIDGKSFSSDCLTFFSAFDNLVIKQMGAWAFSEKLGFHETLPTDTGAGFLIKIAVKLPNVSSLSAYLPLAESKKVILSMVDNIIYLSHKLRYKPMYQCIMDIMEVLSAIAKAEDEKEQKAAAAAVSAQPPAVQAPVPMEIKKEEPPKPAEPVQPAPAPVVAAPAPAPAPAPEEKKAAPAPQKGFFTAEILKEHENTKTSTGLTIHNILTASASNPEDTVGIFIEGVESFNAFNKLYTNALKEISQGKFDLATFNYNLKDQNLTPLDLPVLPTESNAKYLQISRNLHEVPFSAFMQDADRTKSAKIISDALTSITVYFLLLLSK